ncbi:MAG: hypothetical protein ACRDHD_04245 [Candidatus Limnocylindria bacterium]
MRDVLTGLHQREGDRAVLRSAGIDRFVPLGDGAYDDIRGMLTTVIRSGLLPPWWRARWRAEAGHHGP